MVEAICRGKSDCVLLQAMATPVRRGLLVRHTQAPTWAGACKGYSASGVEIGHWVESKCGRWCQPRDEHPITTSLCATTQSTHIAENTRLNCLPVDWRPACILMSRRGVRNNYASDCGIHRKRTGHRQSCP